MTAACCRSRTSESTRPGGGAMARPPARIVIMAGTDRIVRAAPATTAALVVAVVGIATVLGAWFFQFGLGYVPCPLCYEQRIPYYVGIPLALMVAFASGRRAPRGVILAGLAALALIMLWGAGIA